MISTKPSRRQTQHFLTSFRADVQPANMSDAEMQEEELEGECNNILMDAIMIMIMMADYHAEYAGKESTCSFASCADGVVMRCL